MPEDPLAASVVLVAAAVFVLAIAVALASASSQPLTSVLAILCALVCLFAYIYSRKE